MVNGLEMRIYEAVASSHSHHTCAMLISWSVTLLQCTCHYHVHIHILCQHEAQKYNNQFGWPYGHAWHAATTASSEGTCQASMQQNLLSTCKHSCTKTSQACKPVNTTCAVSYLYIQSRQGMQLPYVCTQQAGFWSASSIFPAVAAILGCLLLSPPSFLVCLWLWCLLLLRRSSLGSQHVRCLRRQQLKR